MDINKRTILWIVFSVSLVILWNNWMVANGNQSMFSMQPPPAQVAPAPGTVPGTTPGANAGVPLAQAGTATGAAVVPGAAVPAPAVQTEVVTITTDVFKVQIDTAGGVIKHLELFKYRDKVDPTKNQVLFDVNNKGTYVAQTGLIRNTVGEPMPTHNTPFVARPGPRSLDNANEISLVLEAMQGGVKLTKTFTFKRGDYLIGMRHDVTNMSTVPVAPSLYLQLLHHGNEPEGESYFTASYTGPTMYTSQNHYEKLQFADIEKHGKAEHTTAANDGWVAISQHYFVSAFLPPQNMPRTIFTKKMEVPNLYAIGTVMPLGTIAPGATVSNDTRLYSGPQIENKLETIAPGLERVKDYGVLHVLAAPMFWVMDQIHNVVGNWGWTIIIFTILIKLLFFPLSAAGYKSMARIKVVTPKMQAIREKYKNDPLKMNQATMELYKTEKINPLGGCLPILVQMPVFIALYWVLQASAEMRGAPWLGWITDLTAPDPYFILPILYAISMYITTKLNPAPADPIQAKMMLFMPLLFSVAFIFFPAGLVLYWVVNNILSIGQQWVITKKYEEAAATTKK
ncbi:membrane protein insertase YidC [Massilia sp. PAMC28688]|uniref:membrane protein insertase YidC n=1 Tax=Massilia sp. PAMC28688 TaxID=2861283 RepID=UPI001C6323AC|nr:membrane protein insertase YidC [Massilia sp. PAMC28688]QYF95438.1 membrane protein insertase YidC [Massilia sp. PAMC28688]